MTLSTTVSNFIYLGNFADVDPTEGNYTAENAANLVALSIPYSTLKLVPVTMSTGLLDGDVNDNDYYTSDSVSYNLGSGSVTQQVDSTLTAKVTLTLGNGSTKQIEVVLFQSTNGDLFAGDLDNCGDLDNRVISGFRIDSITGASYSGLDTCQTVTGTSFAAPPILPDGVVDGETSAEVMGVGYNDANAPSNGGGDKVTNGADSIRGNAGNDTIDGGSGNDSIDAGTGDDSVFGGLGNDSLIPTIT